MIEFPEVFQAVRDAYPDEPIEKIAATAAYLHSHHMVTRDRFRRLDWSPDAKTIAPKLTDGGILDVATASDDEKLAHVAALGRPPRLPDLPVAAPSGSREERAVEWRARASAARAAGDALAEYRATIAAAEIETEIQRARDATAASARLATLREEHNGAVDARREKAIERQAAHTNLGAAKTLIDEIHAFASVYGSVS